MQFFIDGKVKDRMEFTDNSGQNDKRYRYIEFETDQGIIDIINSNDIDGITIGGSDADNQYSNLKAGDSVRIAFLYYGYYEPWGRPEGFYISTLKSYEPKQSTNSNNETKNDDTNYTGIVWVPKTGKRYHFIRTCSGMKNPQSMSLGSAKSAGYSPCSKCAH